MVYHGGEGCREVMSTIRVIVKGHDDPECSLLFIRQVFLIVEVDELDRGQTRLKSRQVVPEEIHVTELLLCVEVVIVSRY